MLTVEQIKMARALLGWDQSELSERSGVSLPQIASIETGKVKSPRVGTLTAIRDACVRAGAEFKDGGVFPKSDPTTRFVGEGWFLKVLDDIHETLKDEKNKELLIFGGDNSVSPPDVVEKFRTLCEMGVTIREMVEEGNTHLMGREENYRWIPKAYFQNFITVIYADKVCNDFHTHGLLIKDKHWAVTERNKFNLIWSQLPPLEIRSTSNVRY
jgi:transcriptional regulator with XRE-family HTH domain